MTEVDKTKALPSLRFLQLIIDGLWMVLYSGSYPGLFKWSSPCSFCSTSPGISGVLAVTYCDSLRVSSRIEKSVFMGKEVKPVKFAPNCASIDKFRWARTLEFASVCEFHDRFSELSYIVFSSLAAWSPKFWLESPRSPYPIASQSSFIILI